LALFLGFGAFVNIQYNSYLMEVRGLDPSRIGLINAIGSLASLFSPLLAGWWADRSGRPRTVLAVYGVLSALVLLALPQLQGVVALGIGYFLLQTFLLPVPTLSQSLVMTRASGAAGGFLALRAMGTLGFFLVTLFYSHWITREHIGTAYLIFEGLLLLSLPVHAWLPAGKASQKAPLRLTEVVAYLWRKDLRAIYWCGGLGYMAYGMAGSVLGNFVTGVLHRPPAAISQAWAIATGIEMVVMFAAIPYLRRFGIRSLLLLGFFSTAIRYAWVGASTSYAMFLWAQALHGLMVAGLLTGQSLYLARRLPADRVSSGTAAAAILNGGVMTSAGAWLAGVLWAHCGLRWVYAVAGFIALLGGVTFWYFTRHDTHSEEGVSA
jgi:predicted MFS family arabinose efflux permease